MNDLWTAVDWIGRVGFSVCFLMFGAAHFLSFQGITAYAGSKKIPAPGVAVAVTGLMLLAGGAMILLQWHPLWGAGLIIAFLIPVAFLIHNFWTETDPMMRSNQQAHFCKNLSIAFALMMYAVAVHS